MREMIESAYHQFLMLTQLNLPIDDIDIFFAPSRADVRVGRF